MLYSAHSALCMLRRSLIALSEPIPQSHFLHHLLELGLLVKLGALFAACLGRL